jgi:uncharacterized DUF497 family protein
VDFTATEGFDWDTAVVEFEDEHDEPRWVAKGFIGLVLHFMVLTDRGSSTRVISLRKATRREALDYAKERSG